MVAVQAVDGFDILAAGGALAHFLVQFELDVLIHGLAVDFHVVIISILRKFERGLQLGSKLYKTKHVLIKTMTQDSTAPRYTNKTTLHNTSTRPLRCSDPAKLTLYFLPVFFGELDIKASCAIQDPSKRGKDRRDSSS